MFENQENRPASNTSESMSAVDRIATITLGIDGRVYFHDLPPEFLEVAAEISPTASAVAERLRLAGIDTREHHVCGRREVNE